MDFIAHNMTWIFSGIGVLAIALLVDWWRRRRSARPVQSGLPMNQNQFITERSTAYQAGRDILIKQTPEPLERAESTKPYFSITPQQITDVVQAAPPLQQKSVGDRYAGIKIRWLCYLRTGSENRDGTTTLLLRAADGFTDIVVDGIPSAEYKELNILPRGSPIQVDGKIVRVTNVTIHIENARLTFPDQKR